MAERARLFLRLWWTFAKVRLAIGRPLPQLVRDLAEDVPSPPARAHDPERLSAGVFRALRLGRRRPTCLLSSLVLLHMLRRQGDPAQLLIGLPAHPVNKNAHAWVELHGRAVGPPPGPLGHEPLARYPEPLSR